MNCRRIVFSMAFASLSLVGLAQTCSQFRLDEVKLLPSRFQENMKRDSAWIASIDVNRLLHSFRNTAGVFTSKEGGYMTVKKPGGWESLDCDLRGHITGHLLSAMANLQMKAKADSLVQGLAEVQRQYGTGYLSAFGEGLIDRNIQGKSVWAPFYTLHKIVQGLIDQYTLCGNATALEVAKGMGLWAYNKLTPLDDATRRRMIRNEFGGFNEAMYNLYAITKDERYLNVARFFYHNDKVDPLKAGNKDLGTNHANTFIPKLLGECRNYELFGNEDSRHAAELLFSTLTEDHAFVTGEVSDKEHLFKPETQSKHLTGYDGENCCSYNLMKLSDHLFSWNPRSSVADYYERALYTSELTWGDTNVRLSTRFPEDGKVTIIVSGASRRFDMKIRCPYWATYMKVNGKKAKVGSDGYAVVSRNWKQGDKVTLEFGMTLTEEPTKDNPSLVALKYGPVVLGARLAPVAHPFSDPKKYNDYYTFDYGKHKDVEYNSVKDFRQTAPLHFENADGTKLEPLYNLHHCRYAVYLKKR